ncbi:MAG: glycosyltransferase [Agathobacter sp.]|nr:glycosyltransferase [Agathobacter sp.]
MKKILFVTSDLDRGGAQRVLSILANEYTKRGWEVHIAMLLNNRIGYDVNEKILIHDLSKSGNYVKNILHWIKGLRAIASQVKPNIVVSFVGRVNMIAMMSTLGMHIPVLVSERNDPLNDRRSKLEVELCKRFYSHANRVVFQTNYQREFYKKYCSKNSVIIGNPIAAPIYTGEHVSKDIVSVGKLMEQKNHSMLIKAFAKIADIYPDKSVHIYGKGELKESLQQLVNELNLENRIVFEGNIDNIFPVLHKNEYFVMCSNYEGLSNALLEAMTSGMLCISTNWNGVQDIIQDGENGLLVPIDDEDALAEKLKKVFEGEYDETAIKRKAIKKAEEYQTKQIINQWYTAIEELCD